KKGRDRPAPLGTSADGSALGGRVGTGRSGLRDHLTVDHRQAIARRTLIETHGLLFALVVVGHVVTDHLVLGAQRDALARLAAGTHAARGAVRVAIGHVVAHHRGRLRRVRYGAAVGLDPLGDLAAHMVAVDPVADVATGHGTGHGRGLLAVAATDLVTQRATDQGADDGAADVAVALGGTILHDHVLTHLARGRGGAGLAHRVGTDHGREQLLLFLDRLDTDHVGEFDTTDAAVGGEVTVKASSEFRVGGERIVLWIVLEALVRGHCHAANDQRRQCNSNHVLVHG